MSFKYSISLDTWTGNISLTEMYKQIKTQLKISLKTFYGTAYIPQNQMIFRPLTEEEEQSELEWLENFTIPEESKGLEPQDNSERDYCFWCGKKTIEKECFTSIYKYCPDCNK